MACKTLADLVPVSSLGFSSVEKLLKKIPQIKPKKTKGWKELQKAMNVAMWLSNPSNLAALKQVADAIKNGDPRALLLLANLTTYAGMDGMVDLSKVGSALSGVKDAFDCINKNINALSEVENQIINTVRGVLTTSNMFSMLGLSQVMQDLHIADSYAFSQLQTEINSKLGFSVLASAPGLSGVLPAPPGLSQTEQALYAVNGLTQYMYLLSVASADPKAQSVLQHCSQAAALLSPTTASSQISTLPAASTKLITDAITNNLDTPTTIIASRSANAQALSALSSTTQVPTSSTPSGPLPAPPVPSGSEATVPMPPAAAQVLQTMGPVAVGNLQDAATKTEILLGQDAEVALWRKRQLQIIKSRYQKQFYQVDKDSKEVSSMTSQAAQGAQGLSSFLDLLQSRNPALSEQYRVLDFKLKLVTYAIADTSDQISSNSSKASQLSIYGSALQQFSPVNTRPYTASDPRTYGTVTAKGCTQNGVYSDACKKELENWLDSTYNDTWLSSSQKSVASLYAGIATRTGVPPRLAIALGLTEGSLSLTPGDHPNSNGTLDMGPLQINSAHVGESKPGGGTITLSDLRDQTFNISFGIDYFGKAYAKAKSLGFTGEELIRNAYLGYNSGPGTIGRVPANNANISRFLINYLRMSGCCHT